jgi:hypothetical protein
LIYLAIIFSSYLFSIGRIYKMRFNVSRPQFNKLSKGQSINLSHGALREGGDMSGRGFAVDFAQGLEKKINTAIRNNKGIRIKPSDVSVNGGSILGSISSAFKSAGNTIKKTATKAGDAIKKSANQTGQAIKKSAIQTGDKIVDISDDIGLTKLINLTATQTKKITNDIITDLKKNSGKRMEMLARYIPREYVETALDATIRTALLYAVGPQQADIIASTASLTLTDALYDHDFEQSFTSEANKESLLNSLKDSAKESVNRIIHSAIDAGATSLVQSGIRSDNQRRHDAVSAEAKMMGLGFMSTLKKGASAVKKGAKKASKSSIAKELGAVATPILKDMAHEEIETRNNQMLERYGNNRLNDALIKKSTEIAHRKVEGRGFLSMAKKGLSAAKKTGKSMAKSSIAKELSSVAKPIAQDMLHEEIANRHMEMADRYGDSRLGSALVNKSADIAHRRVQGKGIRGGSILDGSYTDLPEIGSDTRGLNFLANFQSMGLRDKNQVDSFTDFAEGTETMSGMGLKGNGFAYAHGRGLNGGNILSSLSLLAQGKGIVGRGRFAKGSQEAKDYMASLRAKRMKKKE